MLNKTAEVATKTSSVPRLLRIDTQAHWWLLEVEWGGKAVQILAAAHAKVMNTKFNKIDIGPKVRTYPPIAFKCESFQWGF